MRQDPVHALSYLPAGLAGLKMRAQPTSSRPGNRDRVADHFELLAADYHSAAFLGAGMAALSQRDLGCVTEAGRLARLDGRHGLRACDVGVGTGRVSTVLERLGFQVAGLDVSMKMLSEARTRLNTRSLLLASLADGLPYSTGSFDLVTCMRVLKYLPDWQEGIVELARVVGPGGIVCFDLANRRSVARFGYPPGLVWATTHPTASRAIEVAGLEIVSEQPGAHLPDPMWRAATSPRSARALQAVEDLAATLTGYHGARSWTFIAQRPG